VGAQIESVSIRTPAQPTYPPINYKAMGAYHLNGELDGFKHSIESFMTRASVLAAYALSYAPHTRGGEQPAQHAALASPVFEDAYIEHSGIGEQIAGCLTIFTIGFQSTRATVINGSGRMRHKYTKRRHAYSNTSMLVRKRRHCKSHRKPHSEKLSIIAHKLFLKITAAPA
jgi:hypothetical protein